MERTVVVDIMLALSVGLLRQRNPARLVFIAVTFFCIAWSVADLAMRARLGVSISLLPGSVNHAHVPVSFACSRCGRSGR